MFLLALILNDFKSSEITGSDFFDKDTTFYFYSEEFDCLIRNIDVLKGRNAIADYILNYVKTTGRDS